VNLAIGARALFAVTLVLPACATTGPITTSTEPTASATAGPCDSEVVMRGVIDAFLTDYNAGRPGIADVIT
jgi:hypothetical protein